MFNLKLLMSRRPAGRWNTQDVSGDAEVWNVQGDWHADASDSDGDDADNYEDAESDINPPPDSISQTPRLHLTARDDIRSPPRTPTPQDPIGLLRNAQHVRITLEKYRNHVASCDIGGITVKELSIWDTLSLCAILTSHPMEEAVTQCTGEIARSLVNLIQACIDIDNGRINMDSKRRLVRMLIRLSKSSKVVPRTLTLEGVQINEEFARGGFGAVHKGFWNGKPVAVKIMKMRKAADIQQAVTEAAREAVTHRHLVHSNITPFYGVFDERRDNSPALCLVSALMSCNLQEFLDRKDHEMVDVDCVRLALDIAQGLEYMHQEGMIHSDLKSMNILVSINERAFLADFGIAKSVDTDTNKQTTGINGTKLWKAPELFKMDGSTAHATMESDIYAFGLICYEMFSGLIPFLEQASNPLPPSYFGRRPPFPGDDTPAVARGLNEYVWRHMEECWAKEPAARPSAKQVVEFFLDEVDPPEDFRKADVFDSPALPPTPENIAYSFMVW
ncbi:hypothetical protein HWV62_24003 [Athelia sp. TMB]|nr:hypothetical protein HWV62_24003 [Athelia sp. TMB]